MKWKIERQNAEERWLYEFDYINRVIWMTNDYIKPATTACIINYITE